MWTDGRTDLPVVSLSYAIATLVTELYTIGDTKGQN